MKGFASLFYSLLLITAPSMAEKSTTLKIAALPTGDTWVKSCGVATENSQFTFRLGDREPVIVSVSQDARFNVPAEKTVKISIYLNGEEFDDFNYKAGGQQPSCLVYNPVDGEWVWWGATGTCKSPF